MDTYRIYLVNHSVSTQQFWCFLERPVELVGDSQVFANSSVNLALAPSSPATNTFTIPVQYVVGAGASNNAVGLNIQIQSSIILNANLTDQYTATYANVPPNMGPTLLKTGAEAGPTNLAIASNTFSQANNQANGWFANQTFGIQTQQGFIGMTWSPNPGQTRTLTPTLKFYVSVGTFGSNTLASWTTVSTNTAELVVPSSFTNRDSTVTLNSNGTWTVTPGKPTTNALVVAMADAGLATKKA